MYIRITVNIHSGYLFRFVVVFTLSRETMLLPNLSKDTEFTKTGVSLIYCNSIVKTHRHRNRWTANSDEIWLNLRRACAGSKPDTLLPVF